MGHEHDRLSRRYQAREGVLALALERLVPDRQDLIEEQDVGVDMGNHREGEPHSHSRREVLELQVDEVLELRHLDDLLEARPSVPGFESHHHAVELDVVASRELVVEPDAEIDDRSHATGDPDAAGVRLIDPGEELEEGALSGAVSSDHSEELAAPDLEGDVAEDLKGRSGLPDRRSSRPIWPRGVLCGIRNDFSSPDTSTAGPSSVAAGCSAATGDGWRRSPEWRIRRDSELGIAIGARGAMCVGPPQPRLSADRAGAARRDSADSARCSYSARSTSVSLSISSCASSDIS